MISSKFLVVRGSAVRFASSSAPSLEHNSIRQFFKLRTNSTQTFLIAPRRYFSSSNISRTDEKDFFAPPLLPKDAKLKSTHTPWKHPLFAGKDMENVEIAHRPTRTLSDIIAFNAVRFLRFCMDRATGYRPLQEGDGNDPKLAEQAKMTERRWLIRMIFLESVAAVPGMVGGMLRHLHSLRRMKRDNGWIESLLEEAFNERLHLLTFLKLYSPGLFMRVMILGAQGVFFNGFFISYILSPSTCHRFVGYLEEEAVITYTHALADLEAGKLPQWKTLEAPTIAVEYWNMPEGNRMMKDLLLYVRADEAKHREVNHTFGNLDQDQDPNPFVSTFQDPTKPHPNKNLKDVKPIGWTREEAL